MPLEHRPREFLPEPTPSPSGGGEFDSHFPLLGGLVLRSDSSSPCVAGFAEQGAPLRRVAGRGGFCPPQCKGPKRWTLVYHRAFLLGLLALLGWGLWSGLSLAEDPSEYQVKASMLSRFALFVEWPTQSFATASSPLIVGVLGDDPFGPWLEQEVRAMNLQARPINTRRFKGVDEVQECHILFISRSEQKRLPRILARLKHRSTLTVSDLDRFCQQGGMIGFVLQENKVRFEVNAQAAQSVELTLGSKLQRIAAGVWPAER